MYVLYTVIRQILNHCDRNLNHPQHSRYGTNFADYFFKKSSINQTFDLASPCSFLCSAKKTYWIKPQRVALSSMQKTRAHRTCYQQVVQGNFFATCDVTLIYYRSPCYLRNTWDLVITDNFRHKMTSPRHKNIRNSIRHSRNNAARSRQNRRRRLPTIYGTRLRQNRRRRLPSIYGAAVLVRNVRAGLFRNT